MDRQEMRLEILKMRHRFDKDPKLIIDDAKLFEDYIFEELVESFKPTFPTPPQNLAKNKNAGNLKDLLK